MPPQTQGIPSAGPFWFAIVALVIVVSMGSAVGAASEDPPDPPPVVVDEPPDTPVSEDPEATAEEVTPEEAATEEPQNPTLTPDQENAAEPVDYDGETPAPAGQSYAKGSAKEKWDIFVDAWRGLSTWDLFDDRVTLRAYARVQVDGSLAAGDSSFEAGIGELRNSVKIRRFTIIADGTIDNHFRYVFGYEFGVDNGIWDAYVEGLDSGLNVFGYNVGDFRVGSFQEPFSLERVSGSYYGGFLERSLPVQAFSPARNLGYMVHRSVAKERMSWAVGFFSFGSQNEENASSSTLSVTGRLTGLPVWRDEGRHMVHVGVAFSSRNPQSNETRYFSRPEARFVEVVADTGDIDAGAIKLFGAEAAMVQGPLWLQSEVIYSSVSSSDYGDLGFWGGYVQAGYFLTGEVRPYNRAEGKFDRVYPRGEYEGGVPLRRSNGGAFEVVGRISNLDLNDGGINGGKVLDFSAGLNWYANSTQKVMLNYIRSKVDGVGKANILLLRYQYRPLPRQ
ncbi:MAG: hypothetical protein DRJ61_09530 [Acidobacteria bacterium]|nr:MAG: hypothetical protein DRJ61_09530 [Acidobacteriota bacterium]